MRSPHISLILVLGVIIASAIETRKPNIVFIVADDLGWDDVSFHGSDQILTPNIDVLAYQGVVLNQYYTDSEGTASRSALFTGKYPSRIGMQGVSIKASEDRGISISERLLPAHLRELGYKTHLIGKWGVGKSRACYLPTNRGFDSSYGFSSDAVDYLTYNTIEELNDTSFFGLDLFDNLDVVDDKSGHLTDIITNKAIDIIRNHDTKEPLYLHVSHAAPHIGGALVTLQPPLESVEANKHISHSARRLYAGLVTSLDNSVGHIIATLAERDILQNTIVVFVSDNGAPAVGAAKNFGSNFPFRGTKGSPWEGGVRTIGLVWYATMALRIHNSIFHVTDWLPTLVTAAGGNINHKIDGINQWAVLMNNETPQRNEALITIDDLNGWAAFREAKGCLYEISVDPTEINDLWYTLPDVVRRMSLRLRSFWTESKARRRPQSDPRADPSLRNYVWFPWVNDEQSNLEPPPVPMFPLQVSLGEMQYLVDLNFNLLKDKLNTYIGNVKESITESVGKLFYT
ncbi:unnamed protein product [Diatraea saccharalis]|uniref:Sulfatase N-terminal domain-containing protein n=1 Tax=Diatraea saccharalis TaxID=40085 RepID=A0A9N9RCZ6_9NEOP|nr:unnamed protein product [Diatraea saccharalis]